ncbi:DUF1054 family protein, partial [Bacillus altitudinis]|uniref:DUF1054 family protein n=1 Tax=Bacillus altitudinis TaxID=293387 RepID=UPI0011A808B7
VGLGKSKGGYKKVGDFEIGVWKSHVFVWFGVIYECGVKGEYGELLEKEVERMEKKIGEEFVWSKDDMKGDVVGEREVDGEQLRTL